MSGLAGIIDWYGKLQNCIHEVLPEVLHAQSHRGNSPKDFYYHAPAYLACHPFYATPQSETSLPLVSPCQKYVIVADIRLDNREDLCQKLDISYDMEKFYSDSALVIAAYQHWAEACVDHLLGDYAFALWNAEKREIFCVMSPIRIKPLFYARKPDGFYFASEPVALLKIPGVEKKLNALTFILDALMLPPEADETETAFAGIHYLRGGQYLKVSAHDWHLYQYWQLKRPSKRHFISEEECLYEFRQIFQRSIRDRMRGASSIATYLSGGLDSSSITCEVIRQARERGIGFDAFASTLPEGYIGPNLDEKPFIQLIEKKFDFKTHYISPTYFPLDNLEQAFRASASSFTPTPNLYRALTNAISQQGHTQVLDGFFGELGPTSHAKGYFNRLARQGHWIKLFQQINQHAKVFNLSPITIFKREIISPSLHYFLEKMGLGSSWFRHQQLITKKNWDKYRLLAREKDYRQLICAWEYDYLINFFNRYKISLEMTGPLSGCRPLYPFFDLRILDFCLALDESWYFRKGWKRYLMRASMQDILPPEIQWRKDKMPFYPDYCAHHESQSEHYLAQIEDLKKSSMVTEYINLDNIKKTIVHLNNNKPWKFHDNHLSVLLVVDCGLQAANFIRWFEKI